MCRMVVVNVADELALGFPCPAFLWRLPSTRGFTCSSACCAGCGRVASATRNAVELIILVAGLVLLLCADYLDQGLRCSAWIELSHTCDSSIAWLQSLLAARRYSHRVGRGARFSVLSAPHRGFADYVLAVGVVFAGDCPRCLGTWRLPHHRRGWVYPIVSPPAAIE